MTSASPEFVFEELLEHEAFVRNTLRGLLTDEGRVQDLAQETWLRVLQQRPMRLSEPRAWLGRVARNLALSSWRSDARRARREHERATDGSSEAADLGHERLELRQQVVTAVLELEEPYRAVVILRYEHSQTTSEISEHLARPVGTVRSQLSRAHELLRVRLDAEFGGRERWAALALPAASAPASGLAGFLLPAAFWATLAAGAWLLVRELGPAADSPPVQALVPVVTRVAPRVEQETAALQAHFATDQDRVAVSPPLDESEDQTATLELLRPVAVLQDRSYFDDYERATFSFEYGIRDDPERVHTRNDWEIHLSDDVFDVNMVTDDQSVIADLGKLEPSALRRISVASIRFTQTATVQVGHAYYIGTRDTSTDLATFVFVRSHEPGRTCTFDWYTTDGSGRAQGSISNTGSGLRWVDVLTEIRRFQRDGSWLQIPRVVLQVRGGAGGGNSNRINMAGEASAYVDEISPEPLDLLTPADSKDRNQAYCEGGWIPEHQVFVVSRVSYTGTARGDSNGHGGLRVVVGGETLYLEQDTDLPLSGVWTGSIELQSGDETGTYLEMRNSSTGQVVLEGTFQDAQTPEGFGAANEGFFKSIEVTQSELVERPVLAGPRALLQVRAGAGGGNPNRVDLRGRTSIYVSKTMDRPLDLETPVEVRDPSLAYSEAGWVDAGVVFIVTQAVYRGSAKGDSNGQGGFKLVVGGELLAESKETDEPIRGSWTGRIAVAPGEESRTYIEVANSSTAEVVLTGYFE